MEGKWQVEEARVAMPSLGFWNPSDYVGIDNYKKILMIIKLVLLTL
jgi:hypothetical protein